MEQVKEPMSTSPMENDGFEKWWTSYNGALERSFASKEIAHLAWRAALSGSVPAVTRENEDVAYVLKMIDEALGPNPESAPYREICLTVPAWQMIYAALSEPPVTSEASSSTASANDTKGNER